MITLTRTCMRRIRRRVRSERTWWRLGCDAGTLGLSTTLRNAMLDAITTAIGTSGKVRIYSGTRPATGGTATTLLAELPCGS